MTTTRKLRVTPLHFSDWLQSKSWPEPLTLTEPIKDYRLTQMGSFKASQFQFVLNRGDRRKAYFANGIVTPIGVVSMWEAWFQ
jgi:hypothetical protein